jgi:hypothetical protein
VLLLLFRIGLFPTPADKVFLFFFQFLLFVFFFCFRSFGRSFSGFYSSIPGILHIAFCCGFPGCQDWTVHYGEEAGGNTLVVISRKFLTDDANDHPILLTGLKKTTLLLAFGTSDTLAYHNTHRVKLIIDLSSGVSTNKAHFVARLNATPGMSYIDLRFNNATAPFANGVDDRFKAPDAGGREILTVDRTAYWDYCFTTAANPGWSAHQNKVLVAFNGILDPGASRTDLVHHAVLYAYDSDNCWNDESIIWVGGTTDQASTEFPADVGMKFSRFKSFRIQVHYDNPLGTTGLKDNSGIRMWLSVTGTFMSIGSVQVSSMLLKAYPIPLPALHTTL